jgi:hypothetical protein
MDVLSLAEVRESLELMLAAIMTHQLGYVLSGLLTSDQLYSKPSELYSMVSELETLAHKYADTPTSKATRETPPAPDLT